MKILLKCILLFEFGTANGGQKGLFLVFMRINIPITW